MTARILISRNKREGHYRGKYYGCHERVGHDQVRSLRDWAKEWKL